ncbi:MAG: glycosyltransferase family 2 protein, partial [Bacteroidota bacterium]|nr:glycosyltransferase family 2 protein [Bacteroidota bacterium]
MQVVIYLLWILFYAVNIILAIYFLLPIFLFLIHLMLPASRKLAGKRYPKKINKDFDFAAIITAHQDVKLIPPLIDSFLKQDYKNFIVYIIADDCDITGLQYNDERIRIIKPAIPFHAKIKSIHFAVESFERKHDALIIFDSDNLVHPKYLSTLNTYFQKGFRAVQTHMLSKNFDSTYAKLDSVGHIYHTFLERQVKMELGLTSAILGLGIAIDLELYKEIMYTNKLGGFDKKLQVQLAKKLPSIAFAADAIVYDEKVDSGEALEKQRTRWIFTYFTYFKDSLGLLSRGVSTLHTGRILLAINMLRPPLFLTLALAFFMTAISFFVKPVIGIVWIIILVLFAVNFILIVITQSKQKGMAKALVHIPKMIYRQFASLLKISSAKKDFLKT